ncbi:MAG: nickel transporter [Acidobacteriota bacterium]
MLTTLFVGLVAGSVHALSGPDHLAAVAPLSLTATRRPWLVGLRWGLGHALGVGVVGALVLPLRSLLNLQALSFWSERLVGLMLIGVGLWGLGRASSKWIHSHHHRHGTDAHVHIHLHKPGQVQHWSGSHRHSHATLGVGLLHGVAGTSHLFGLLPALALPDQLGAASYIAGYGAGNLLAMGSFTGLVGLANTRLQALGARSYCAVLGACSIAAIGMGLIWLVT